MLSSRRKGVAERRGASDAIVATNRQEIVCPGLRSRHDLASGYSGKRLAGVTAKVPRLSRERKIVCINGKRVYERERKRDEDTEEQTSNTGHAASRG